jgi:hypothetical protein
MHQLSKTLLVMLTAALAAGCARAYPPPGSEPDRLPPALVSTSPEPLEVVPGYRGPVVFRFDERLSERNFSEALVTVSPLDGAVRLRRAGNEVRVEIDGGWRPDRIYRVVLLPGIRDLFGNVRDEATEIVFSTGPPVPHTAVAGLVIDRLTNRPVQTAVVRAARRGEDVSYTAIGDTAGFFSLRHLPYGVYDVTAFADVNRNRRRDPAEPMDTARVSVSAGADTATVVFNVLPPDTTPPRVVRAEVVDSLHVRVTFDDHFDPAQSMDGATAQVHVLPDSVVHAGAVRILVGTVFERERRAPARVAEPADTADVRADTVAAPPPAARPPAARPEAPPLPARELVVQLDRPLTAGSYTITVAAVVNINGLTGGGTASFEVAPPPPGTPPPDGEPPPDRGPPGGAARRSDRRCA